jgi:hypothetical protein
VCHPAGQNPRDSCIDGHQSGLAKRWVRPASAACLLFLTVAEAHGSGDNDGYTARACRRRRLQPRGKRVFTIQRASACALAVAAAFATVKDAHAQIVRRGYGGIVVRAPYAPSISVGLRGVIPAVPLVRPYILPRRRFLPPPYPAVAPASATAPLAARRGSEAPRYVPGSSVVAAGGASASVGGEEPRQSWPSRAELARMEDSALLNAALEAAWTLDADVAEFNTGATWRNYFKLPEDAFPPPGADGQVTLGLPSILATLDRIDSVAANPDYDMISSLASFTATQHALQEVVRRFDPSAQRPARPAQPVVDAASDTEELPVPPPAVNAPVQGAGRAPTGQRSILVQ